MTDLLDVLPLVVRTEAQLRTQIDDQANEGKLPDDPDWVDTREGSMFQICTQPTVILGAQVYDRIGTELVAASNLATAWDDYLDLHGESYLVERKGASFAAGVVRFDGTDGTIVPAGIRLQAEQTDPDVPAPEFETSTSGVIGQTLSGQLLLDARALEAGPDGNVTANAITVVNGDVDVSSVTNPDPFGGGADPESDEDYRTRIQLQFQGKGSGTISDYKRWCLSYPGIGRCEVVPAAFGPGTVLVIVADADGDPLPTTILDGLLSELDPVPGQGKGLAPIGHAVSVSTPTVVPANISGTVVFKPGYSLDGTAGTLEQRSVINRALSNYVDRLVSGEDVILEHVSARFFNAPGVLDVSNVRINTVAANLAISSTQIAQLGTTTGIV